MRLRRHKTHTTGAVDHETTAHRDDEGVRVERDDPDRVDGPAPGDLRPVGDDARTSEVRRAEPEEHDTRIVDDSRTTADVRRDHDPDAPSPRTVDEPVGGVATATAPVTRDHVDTTDDDRFVRAGDDRVAIDDEPGRPLVRVPRIAPLAPFGGWLAAWGAAIVAAACLVEAGVGLGLGFGLADGSADVDSGFFAGLWMLVVQVGAFIVGGFVAGRMARGKTLLHAALAWLVAVIATAVDGVVAALRDSGSSILGALRLPQWADLDYDTVVIVPLVIFAAGSLIGTLIGGMLAAGANRSDRTPIREVR